MKLEKARVLLVGAGEVGRRKAVDLLCCKPADLLWIDPGLSLAEVMEQLPDTVFEAASFEDGPGPENGGRIRPPSNQQNGAPCQAGNGGQRPALSRLRYEQREFSPEDLQGRNLVFAATSSREANATLASLCHKRGILCNLADNPDDSDFYVPAHFNQGGIVMALSTGGQSPALARRIRREAQEWMGERYSPLLKVLARIRPLVQGLGLSSQKNCEIFRELANSDLPQALSAGDMEKSRGILLEILPESLHAHMGEILYGTV